MGFCPDKKLGGTAFATPPYKARRLFYLNLLWPMKLNCQRAASRLWWYAVGHCFTAGRRSRHLDDLLRSDTFDLERFGVNGVRLIGFHEPLHVSADALAHGGVFRRLRATWRGGRRRCGASSRSSRRRPGRLPSYPKMAHCSREYSPLR